MTVSVPEGFVRNTLGREGEDGKPWLDGLSDRVARYCTDWSLSLDGPVKYGYVGLVVPVTSANHGPCVLKLSYPRPEPRREAVALRMWNGVGAVQVYAGTDDEAGPVLLLERLDAEHDLGEVSEHEACDVIGELLATLAVPAPPGLPSLRSEWGPADGEAEIEWQRLGQPLSRRALDAALVAWDELPASGPELMLHCDLHHYNVLAGRRESWLAIDPQPCVGDPASGVIPILRNRFDIIRAADDPRAELDARLRRVCAAAGFDVDRARRWAQALATQDVLGMLAQPEPEFSGGPTVADVTAIAEWLAE